MDTADLQRLEAAGESLNGLAACTLGPEGSRDQARRYAELGASAHTIIQGDDRLVVDFDPSVDLRRLETTIAIEKNCCPFFRFHYEVARGRLSVEVDSSQMRPALSAIADALAAVGSTTPEADQSPRVSHLPEDPRSCPEPGETP